MQKKENQGDRYVVRGFVPVSLCHGLPCGEHARHHEELRASDARAWRVALPTGQQGIMAAAVGQRAKGLLQVVMGDGAHSATTRPCRRVWKPQS